ncbi:MAG: choice-of-anchor S family protein [Candidatus Heimdallarchaeota archaeon]
MKKTKILIPLVLAVLILSTTFVHGDYEVTVGQTFNYTVNTSNWSIKLGSNSASVSKCRIFLDSYDEGTSFTVNVTDVVPLDSVSWNLTVGTTDYEWQNDDSDLLQIQLLLIHILPHVVSFAGSTWSQEAVDLGPTVQFLFFFDISDDTIDFFNFFANSTFWSAGAATDPRLSFAQAVGNFDESELVAVFDWIVDGTITYATPYNFELEGVERFKIAFNQLTGVMQGYRLELDYKGVIEGQNFEMKLNQEVTINGYTLPAFYYDKPAGLPGFEWYLSIAAFSTIIISSVIIRKKRK